jgi:hypothetical protein
MLLIKALYNILFATSLCSLLSFAETNSIFLTYKHLLALTPNLVAYSSYTFCFVKL